MNISEVSAIKHQPIDLGRRSAIDCSGIRQEFLDFVLQEFWRIPLHLKGEISFKRHTD